jgi:hypothetical protein
MIAFVNTPKCGSTTVSQALGREKPPHLPASQMGDFEWAALVRDPFDRMVSALNHVYDEDPLPRLMQRAMRAGCQAVFLPQAHFIDRPARLWPFENMESALRWAGVEGEIPHLNPGAGRFSRADIEPWAEQIRTHYASDFVLRVKAMRNPGELA